MYNVWNSTTTIQKLIENLPQKPQCPSKFSLKYIKYNIIIYSVFIMFGIVLLLFKGLSRTCPKSHNAPQNLALNI